MKNYHMYSVQETAEREGTDINNGLSVEEAARRLEKNGKNTLTEEKKSGVIGRFLGQMNDFLIIILLAAACISFVVGIIEGSGDLTEPVIILSIVLINAVIGVIQESRAEKSLNMLKQMSAPTASVIRDGKEIEIPAENVVCGDLLMLRTGHIASADCRLVSSVDMSADESAVTGESVPSAKSADHLCNEDTPLAERSNMVLSSTSVVTGYGKAIAVGTGMDTEVGRVAKLIIHSDTPKTPMQNRMTEFGRKIGIIALIICGLVFMVGVLKGYSAIEMFITSVSLAVAAIPEGLPAIVTIMLALGVSDMARRGALVRHLPSVETLGSANVICTDKTGTLTENKMKVTRVFTEDNRLLSLLGSLCCTENTQNPTEIAIIRYKEENAVDNGRYKKLKEIPFRPGAKKMTVLYRFGSENRIISKGAADVLLPKCTGIWDGHRETDMTLARRRIIEHEMQDMARSALRVIAVTYANTQNDEIDERSMTFLGLFGIEDPARPEAAPAVRMCRRAGIIPVMITGDHPETACAIAQKTGIYEEGKRIVTGNEIDKMSDEYLEQNIGDFRIFARVTPEHKVRIVKAWRKNGAVTAMTGDGVNDAPALKIADIGCSLGRTGTDVAKAASDMVLTDDNFATIVEAVKHGRLIYKNIKKTVKFLLSSNMGEIFTIFIGILMGFGPPLTAIQLLWVNLVTDSLPAIALGVDPADTDLMDEAPSKASLFSKSMLAEVFIEGAMIGMLALLAFTIGKNIFGSIAAARTMAFSTLSISQLVHSFNMRSEKSVLNGGIFKNHMLVASFCIGVALQMVVVQIPACAGIFKVSPMNLIQWLTVSGLAGVPLVTVELQKLLNKKIHKS